MAKAETKPRQGLLAHLREALAGRTNNHPGYDLEREIQDLVEQSLISQGDGEMIDAVLWAWLRETTAGQIMTPRTMLVTMAADTPWRRWCEWRCRADNRAFPSTRAT